MDLMAEGPASPGSLGRPPAPAPLSQPLEADLLDVSVGSLRLHVFKTSRSLSSTPVPSWKPGPLAAIPPPPGILGLNGAHLMLASHPPLLKLPPLPSFPADCGFPAPAPQLTLLGTLEATLPRTTPPSGTLSSLPAPRWSQPPCSHRSLGPSPSLSLFLGLVSLSRSAANPMPLPQRPGAAL